MATKAKKRRRPSALAGAKKSRKKAGLTATKKFAGKTYKKSSCSRLKSAADKTAKNARAKGKAARVVKNPNGGYCVYTRGRASA